MEENKYILEHYAGQGYDQINPNSIFEVKCAFTRTFTNIEKARRYYDALLEEKAMWQIYPVAELLEAHRFTKVDS
jgi:hypothetical protein